MKNEITWAANIPLIGGFPIGCEKAMGKPPVSVYSYDGFWDNDSHYMNYLLFQLALLNPKFLSIYRLLNIDILF